VRYRTSIRIGPAGFRIGADWRGPIDQLRDLYADYPVPAVPDFTVRLEAVRPWRRWIRPSVRIAGDFTLPEAAPLPLAHGLLAAEMAMNLQMALGWRRHLLLHASSVERAGRAVLMSGESGAGKSTLAALLALGGWRLMGDEFALVEPATGLAHAFPRAISLKNESVAAVAGGRWGPLLAGTPKGDIRHLVPAADAVAAMDVPARPVLLVFPQFGLPRAVRRVEPSEAFVRLTQASTNYQMLGEAGFACLARLVREVPAVAIDYPDGASGVALVEELAE
jgi:HprK-related kinase A